MFAEIPMDFEVTRMPELLVRGLKSAGPPSYEAGRLCPKASGAGGVVFGR